MGLKYQWFDYQNQDSVVNRMRKKRFDHFRGFLKKCNNDQNKFKILDIGGSFHYWHTVGVLNPEYFHVTLLNQQRVYIPSGITPGFASVKGDARSGAVDLSLYDLIFSNSTLEHLGSYDSMGVLAERIYTSGKPYYIQTPSYWFPLEPHCRVPFFQFFPRSFRAWLIWHYKINYFPRGRSLAECLKVSDSTILLTRKQMQKLFPDAEIMTEMMMGFPKSYTAFRGDVKEK
jgi:hypothetical protein